MKKKAVKSKKKVKKITKKTVKVSAEETTFHPEEEASLEPGENCESDVDCPPEEKSEEQICQESVTQMREIDQEREIAEKKGWHRLGRFMLEVTNPLTESELAQDGKSIAGAMKAIEKLEVEKKAYNDDINKKIKNLMGAAQETASRIEKGDVVDTKYFPVFLDPETKERVYFDYENDEEVKREPAKPNDLQLKMDIDQANASMEPSDASEETKVEPDSVEHEDNGLNCENDFSEQQEGVGGAA